MSELRAIEEMARRYALMRQHLAEAVGELEAETAALRRRRLPRIKRLATITAAEHESLARRIADNRGLFAKPRTRLFHGIRVGLEKGKGKIKWSSAARVVQLIRRHFTADRAEALIKVSETPLKSALAQLPAADLKLIGVTLAGTGDQVVVKPADSEIDKLVAALLDDGATAADDEEES